MLRRCTRPLFLSASFASADAHQANDQIAAWLRAHAPGEAPVAVQTLRFAAAGIEAQL